MTATTGPQDRTVLPRWRRLGRTTELGELDALTDPPPESSEELEELEEIEADWLANRSLSFASEFAGAAIVLRQPDRAEAAARFILDYKEIASPSEQALARRVLEGEEKRDRESNVPPGELDTSPKAVQSQVHELKQRLRRDPRNAVAWTDLAHAYVTLGLQDRADRAMRIALALAPENRFLVRAGARLLVQRGEADKAHALLLRTKATRDDPWLMATEIAVADVAGRKPTLLRRGRLLLESGRLAPRHVSELASSIGTEELRAGNDRRARRLFRSSLVDANDNSLAQAEWASERLSGFTLDIGALSEPIAFEARARFEVTEGRWKEAVAESWNWHFDQPFAADAAIFGSYAASVGLLDFQGGVRFAEAGLASNPSDPMLLNNLAYALIESGDLERGAEALSRVQLEVLESRERIVHLATRGLLAFRMGNSEEGRRLYQMSMALSQSTGYTETHAMAAIKLALEELLVGSPYAQSALEYAAIASSSAENQGVRVWRQILLETRRQS
jgi:Flp pilus assembly protein TadD